MHDDAEERALRAEVAHAREQVDEGNETQDVIVHALRELGDWLRRAERTREAVTTLSEARQIAKQQVRASRSNPHKQLTLLMDVDLELAAVQVGLDRSGCQRTLREAAATLAKLDPSASERRHVTKALARLRDELERAPASEPLERREEHFRHARFGEGVLVRREASGLRIRFDDGTERVLKADRVSAVTSRD